MENGNKSVRLLFLQEIFNRQTDIDHVFSAIELCDKLSEYNVTCERKSLYRDIEALRESGMDIVCTRTPKRGYYLRERKFDAAEVRLLIDAVQAAKFISVKNTKSLIYKIGSFMSESQEEKLREQVYVDGSFKSDKEDLFVIINELDRAIKDKNQLLVTYARKIIKDNKLTDGEGKMFVINPYALIWANDHYYLVCNNDKYSNLMHLRLDRIIKIQQLDTKAKHFSKVSDYTDNFDTADYSNKVFNMFSGEPGNIELSCSNAIIDDIIERFGENVPLIVENNERFKFKATVELSEGLVSWILQYGKDICVSSPIELKNAVKERVQEILSIYE